MLLTYQTTVLPTLYSTINYIQCVVTTPSHQDQTYWGVRRGRTKEKIKKNKKKREK